MSLVDSAKRIFHEGMRAVRRDAFLNTLTGIGTTRDKRTGAGYCADAILQPVELDTLFSTNDLANTIVSKLVDDALREGFELKRRKTGGKSKKPAPGQSKPPAKQDAFEPRAPSTDLVEAVSGAEDPDDLAKERELAEQILARCKELAVREKVASGALWGRLFGGGGVILGVQGGGDLRLPLKDDRVKRIEFLIDVDRQDLVPYTWKGNGEPETFLWTPTLPSPAAGTEVAGQTYVAGSAVVIHSSRVVLFPGAKTTNRSKARNQGWDHSVLQRVYNTLQGVDGMWASVEHMFADMSQGVFKLQGFVSAMAEADGEEGKNFETRLQLMDRMRSVVRAIILDAGDETGAGEESFENVERGALTGIDGVVDKAFIRLACAARMPVTVLMGQSPAGMDATGDSDLEIWYNEVNTYRKHVVEPRLERIVQLLARELGDSDPTLWCIDWPTLEQADAKEEAEIDEIRTRTALSLVAGQVVLPEELALSLKKVAPNLGLEIDETAREDVLEQALETVRNPPDPVEMGLDPFTHKPLPVESTGSNGNDKKSQGSDKKADAPGATP